MGTLLLRLSAPLQSWGVGSKFETRNTQREPSKSGIIGLLASSMGIKRNDDAALMELSNLKFGIRVDREGKLLCDFHTVHHDTIEKRSYITRRYYLSDAVFLCGLESDNNERLRQYEYSLTHPKYPLFLGRRSCPPTLPLVIGIRECNLETALQEEPKLVDVKDAVRFVLDAEQTDKDSAVIKDKALSFNPQKREFGYRRYREFIIPVCKQTEHDPFAEVEAENVFNKDET